MSEEIREMEKETSDNLKEDGKKIKINEQTPVHMEIMDEVNGGGVDDLKKKCPPGQHEWIPWGPSSYYCKKCKITQGYMD